MATELEGASGTTHARAWCRSASKRRLPIAFLDPTTSQAYP